MGSPEHLVQNVTSSEAFETVLSDFIQSGGLLISSRISAYFVKLLIEVSLQPIHLLSGSISGHPLSMNLLRPFHNRRPDITPKLYHSGVNVTPYPVQLCQETSQGLMTSNSGKLKSLEFRVTNAMLCCNAVAASRLSIAGNGLPASARAC